MMLEFMPLGNKLELKKMMQEQQQAKQPEPPKTALSINFKDLPIEAQAAILASNGIKVDPQSIADQKDIAMQAQNQPRI
jgi:hypothetical protein